MGKSKKWLLYLLVGGVVSYALYTWLLKRKVVAVVPKPKQPLPPNAVMTGKVQGTTNNRPPNYPNDTVGFGKKNWAEVKSTDGQTNWVEVDL